VTAGRLVPLSRDNGYPQLGRDVTRSLARGTRVLAADAGVVIGFDRDPAVLATRWYEITAARTARNLGARPPRPVDLAGWRHAWARATELATLRIGGQLAAWLIARPGPAVYEVIAGQMNGPWRDRRPGLVLEAVVVARALAGATPWPPMPDLIEDILKAADLRLSGGGYAAHSGLDWGAGHPEKLLTR
jgi:hypothetical protein